jgi:uncharacterized protein (TIGR04222 family)
MIAVLSSVVVGCYAVLGWTLLVLAVSRRRGIRRGRPVEPVTRLSVTEIAVLSGEAGRAVDASVARLRACGAILVTPTGNAGQTGPLPAGSDATTEAVYRAAGLHHSRGGIATDAGVNAATALVEAGLRERGWMVSTGGARRWRRAGYAVCAVTVTGLLLAVTVFLLSFSTGDNPDDTTAAVLAWTFLGSLFATTVLLHNAPPEVTAAARRAVRDRLAGNGHLAPARSPSWDDVGPDGAALSVALFGPAALHSADPAYTGRPRHLEPGP